MYMNDFRKQFQQNCNPEKYLPSTSASTPPKKQMSLASLINWNVLKATELNPNLDLKTAMKSAYDRLGLEYQGESILSQSQEEQHITCAFLAWQQLGHTSVTSLYDFIQNQKIPNKIKVITDEDEEEILILDKPEPPHRPRGYIDYVPSKYSMSQDNNSFVGPVLKLPVESKVVMLMQKPEEFKCNHGRKGPGMEKAIKCKIESICCMSTACSQKLAALEATIQELRQRAAKLANRETQRIELLERAEAAWRDLELGYQRRLARTEEKEEQLTKQIKQLVEERNDNKKACEPLKPKVAELSKIADKERVRLTVFERQICELACMRAELSEESAKGDAALVEQQCKLAQLDRDLQFKEEQARRKITSLESEIQSARGLSFECERAIRFELNALKEQITEVSTQLLKEEQITSDIKVELEDLREAKQEMIEDMDGCKEMCDSKMQEKIDLLKSKRDQLMELQERVIECQCKLPQDAAVEVKRTPSLALLCSCTPEDKYLKSCSCTSLNNQLLSNLLTDLFGGLQSELGTDSGTLMPCQLLKCLEDRHNWDRASVVKTNLYNFFSKLLVEELNIAIATSIEKYHAKWVGESCADAIKTEDSEDGEWQERAIERRAQKLASELAEKIFKEKAEELTKKAKDIVAHGPPPCECVKSSKRGSRDESRKGKNEPKGPPCDCKGNNCTTTLYPCLVKPPLTPLQRKNNESYLKKTMQDVTEIRQQIEDLKKESIKKVDLKAMENKITKLVQRVSKIKKKHEHTEDSQIKPIINNPEGAVDVNCKHEIKVDKDLVKRTKLDYIFKNYNNLSFKTTNRHIERQSNNICKKLEQSYAVNLCLCGAQDYSSANNDNNNYKDVRNLSNDRDSITRSKSISFSPIAIQAYSFNKRSDRVSCPSRCKCFNKVPSNTSINKLLENLTTWNGEIITEDSHRHKSNKLHLLRDRSRSAEKFKSVNKRAQHTTTTVIESLNHLVEKNKCLRKPTHVASSNISKPNKNVSYISNFPTSCFVTDRSDCKQIWNNNTDPNTESLTKTNSEYMGAVNLDKSNENFCKCIINSISETKFTNVNCPLQKPFKCTKPTTCSCEKSQLSKDKNKVSLTERFPKNGDLKENYKLSQDQHLTDTETNSSPIVEDKYQTDIRNDSFIYNVINKSKIFPDDIDYSVKFLGVTLRNNTYKENNSNNSPMCRNNNNTREVEENNNQTSSSKARKTNDTSTLRCNLSNCDQAPILEGIKKHDFSPPGATKLTGETARTSYDKVEIKDEEKCVCCNTLENTKELEINAFNLLKQHLKEKFSILKHSSNFQGIPVDEENKLFLSVLENIKQVISENTPKQIPCSCLTEEQDKGTWSRAYGLLQEYLKIKIKKVKCPCIKKDDTAETILPSILDKITDLIEKDFARLKDKYKDNKININSNLKSSDIQTSDSLFSKNSMKYYLNKIGLMCDAGTNKSTNDISAQVPYYFSLVNRSCEAMKQMTSEKDASCKMENVMYATDCGCQPMTHEKFYLNKNVIVNHCSEIVPETRLNKKASVTFSDNNSESKLSFNEKDLKYDADAMQRNKESESHSSLHYIGYTLSCSCDPSLGSCVCSKSVVQSNKNEIDCIWKSVVNHGVPKKLSYIMHKNPTNIKSEHYNLAHSNGIHGEIYPECSHQSKRSNTSTNTLKVEDGLVLKDSTKQLKNIHIDSYTFDDTSLCTGTDNKHKFYSNNYDTFPAIDSMKTDANVATLKQSILKDPLKIEDAESETLDFKEQAFTLHEYCNCQSVPLCHVKMLVDNIEKKLIYSKCTCDSLSAEICPVHSKSYC